MKDDREKRAREAVRKIAKQTTRSRSKDGNRQFFRNHLQAASIGQLVAVAREGNTDAIELLRDYAKGARQHKLHVPDDLHAFVWEYFVDGPPKAPPGAKPQDTLLRNMIVCSLVKIVSEYGFDPSRNKKSHGSKETPISACYIVADELGMGESNVEDIWNDTKGFR